MVKVSPWLKNIIGQFLALLLMGTGAFAAQLSAMSPDSNFPAMLAFLNYFLCSTYLIRPFIFGDRSERSLRSQGEREIGGISKNEEGGQSHGSYQRDLVPNGTDSDARKPTMKDRNELNGCCCPDMSNVAMPKPGERLPSIWWYVLAGLIDLQANFLIITSYSFTNMTSVAIIDSFSIPSVMLISFFLLRSRYQWKHYLGVGLCIAGVLGIIANDTWILGDEHRGDRKSESSLFGDLIALTGAFLYACSNVLQEKMVKYGEREQYVGRIGLFGMGFSAILFFSMEFFKFKRAVPLPYEAGIYMVGFVLCLFSSTPILANS